MTDSAVDSVVDTARDLVTTSSGSGEAGSVRVWPLTETRTLVDVWCQDDIQWSLNRRPVGHSTWQHISDRMFHFGYVRSALQCRRKLERLLRRYATVRHHGGGGCHLRARASVEFSSTVDLIERTLLRSERRYCKNFEAVYKISVPAVAAAPLPAAALTVAAAPPAPVAAVIGSGDSSATVPRAPQWQHSRHGDTAASVGTIGAVVTSSSGLIRLSMLPNLLIDTTTNLSVVSSTTTTTSQPTAQSNSNCFPNCATATTTLATASVFALPRKISAPPFLSVLSTSGCPVLPATACTAPVVIPLSQRPPISGSLVSACQSTRLPSAVGAVNFSTTLPFILPSERNISADACRWEAQRMTASVHCVGGGSRVPQSSVSAIVRSSSLNAHPAQPVMSVSSVLSSRHATSSNNGVPMVSSRVSSGVSSGAMTRRTDLVTTALYNTTSSVISYANADSNSILGRRHLTPPLLPSSLVLLTKSTPCPPLVSFSVMSPNPLPQCVTNGQFAVANLLQPQHLQPYRQQIPGSVAPIVANPTVCPVPTLANPLNSTPAGPIYLQWPLLPGFPPVSTW